jgi:hypothetical protein
VFLKDLNHLELSVIDKEEILKLLHEKKRGFQLAVKAEKETETKNGDH